MDFSAKLDELQQRAAHAKAAAQAAVSESREQLRQRIDQAKVDVVIDKGQDRWSQGYSGFQHTRLGDLLRERGVDRLLVTGLATDYCVKHTVLDARRLGFDVTVVEDAIRGVEVNPGDSERAIAEMQAVGAGLARSDAIRRDRTPA